MVKIGIIGLGYWGPNLLRNFYNQKNCLITSVCDKDVNRLKIVKKQYPTIQTFRNAQKLIDDKKIDALIIATPPQTHYPLAKAALTAGKDVFIEKPMTLNSKDAIDLVDTAKILKRIILVDHTFLYSKPVQKSKELMKKGKLGQIVNIISSRINLGIYQKDTNVIGDLAAHDISIINFLLGGAPNKVMAVGSKVYGTDQEDQAYLHLWYKKTSATINVSWLSPIKVRQMIISGTKSMLVYDDMETDQKIKLFDTGISVEKDPQKIFQMQINYHKGDIYSPNIEAVETLSIVAEDFINSVSQRKQPLSNGDIGLGVVKVLEAAMDSLQNGSSLVTLNNK